MSTRRPSRLKQSLSWLLKPQTMRPPTGGELGDDYEHIKRESFTDESFLPLLSQGQNRIRRNMETPSTSRRHSLPEVGCTEGALAVSRPPPFFYSRRLSPMREPDGDSIAGEGVSVHDKERDSNVSIASSEIATWRHASTAKSHKLASRIGRGLSRVSSLSLKIKTGIASVSDASGKVPPIKADPSRGPRTSLPPSDTSAIPYSLSLDLPDLTFTSTSESKSLDTVRSSLLPPPRPAKKHKRLKDPFRATKSRRRPRYSSTTSPGSHSSTTPGIDPARWAEISISAAELVEKYGKENVSFGATPRSQYTEGDESFVSFESFEDFGEETSEDVLMRDIDDFSPSHHPFASSPSPYRRTMPKDPSQSQAQSQILSQRFDSSLARNSTADSMTSFSKWPLPPTYDRFKPQS